MFTVDADGQHDLAVLDELVNTTIDEGLDAMLARRDLSYHGPYKKCGNAVLSGWASVWAGNRLHDVESGTASSGSGRSRTRSTSTGIQVQRDGRGRGRDVPARLPRAERSPRAVSRLAITHARCATR